MRLPSFEYLAPSSLAETLRLLAERAPAAAVLAGGTDLIPRLRYRLVKPDLVLSLSHVPELKEIRLDGLTLKIGACAVLQEVMNHPEVKAQAPGLADALKSIGAPNIQHRIGTIGGNLLLNTRCLFYNQSEWWRSGRERCLKNGGQVCHSLPESKECSASCQSDGAAMLSALSVQVVLKSAKGERMLPLAELFSGKGEAPFTLTPEELLTQVQIFLPPP
ncbi:MAG: FAD binding domain-containing protein, partial [Pseudomonadota bacterium]